MTMSNSGLATTVTKISGGQVVTESIPRLPTIQELREELSYRGSEDNSFRFRGDIIAIGQWDSVEKVYSLSNPILTGMQFPTWLDAFNYLDEEKEAIYAELETLKVAEEEDDE
jgi:hypothetical protein